jgi:hypothetical protein
MYFKITIIYTNAYSFKVMMYPYNRNIHITMHIK